MRTYDGEKGHVVELISESKSFTPRLSSSMRRKLAPSNILSLTNPGEGVGGQLLP